MSDMWSITDNISQKASYFLERTKIIQGNIANIDTPFYKPKDLVFEKHLIEFVQMKTKHPKHINPSLEEKVDFKIVEKGKYSGYDANQVNIEEELAKLAESSIMYKSLVETMKKELTKLKISITGR
ncbi:MAG: flagellar basal body rod protein FlgB [Aquificae bacterium]|nr:flagellar basal body rod protein FlgB [Aquificota bacterium]